MLKQIFKSSEKPLIPKKEAINSKTIQNDIKISLDGILEELNISASKESKISKLKENLELFQKENESIYNKINLLKKFGFTNTPSVTKTIKELEKKESEIKSQIKEIELSIEFAEETQHLTQKYALQYPFLKFVPESLMINIMKKYDLFMGDTYFYAKEIPIEALQMIDKYNDEIVVIRESDINLITKTTQRYIYYGGSDDFKTLTFDLPKPIRMANLKIIAPFSHFSIPELTQRWTNKATPLFVPNDKNVFEINRSGINSLAQEVREILDPIACLKVNGGYIVLHAWDEEAEIPEIKNTFLN